MLYILRLPDYDSKSDPVFMAPIPMIWMDAKMDVEVYMNWSSKE